VYEISEVCPIDSEEGRLPTAAPQSKGLAA